MHTHPVITADEAIAQGTSYGVLLSIARFNDLCARSDERAGESGAYHRNCAQAVRLVAIEVARRQGVQLYGRRAANSNARQCARRRAA